MYHISYIYIYIITYISFFEPHRHNETLSTFSLLVPRGN